MDAAVNGGGSQARSRSRRCGRGRGIRANGDRGESSDRPYALPGRQEELIRAVAALNPRTIVVVNAGGGIATADWIDAVPAFLHGWYLGQAGGTALAEILLGKVNPGGKLPISFEKRWEDCAAYSNYPSKKSPTSNSYAEGIFIGYRWFDKKGVAPLFPFGHGLSYTTFQLSDLRVIPDGPKWKVGLDVTNTGALAGAEVVQIYVGQKDAPVERPPRELKGFQRVDLAPGETRGVEIALPREAFAFYDSNRRDWRVAPGEFMIEAGRSSRDLPLRLQITLD
jgi:beta-glucosidase